MVMSLQTQVTQTTGALYHQQSMGRNYTAAILTQDLTIVSCSHAGLCIVFASVFLNRLTGSVTAEPLYSSSYA
jgi:ABC-type proline/glycine betaine transport system permease subunit